MSQQILQESVISLALIKTELGRLETVHVIIPAGCISEPEWLYPLVFIEELDVLYGLENLFNDFCCCFYCRAR